MFNSIVLRYCEKKRKISTDWWLASLPANDLKFRFVPGRLHYVHKGSPTIYCDEKPYKLEPGKLYFFPQNLSLRAEMEEGSFYEHTALDFFVYPPTRMTEALVIDPSETPLIQKALDILLLFAEQYPKKNVNDHHEYVPLIENYCVNLLKLIDKLISPIETVSSPFIADVLSYIHKNYQKELTIEELSALTNYQKHVFIRKFKQIMGVPPYKYIRTYRLNTAYQLIRAGSHSISQVAMQVGYEDSTSFSHAFKQHFGMHPTEVSNRPSDN